MKKRCRIKPPSNRYKNGSVLRGIGAGAYGLAEGILDTATFGLTDELTDKGFEGLQNLAKTPEDELRTQKGIKETANIVGAGTAAIGASILAPGLASKLYKPAIEEGVEGAAGALDATNNEALGTAGEGLTMASNVAMPFLKFKYGGVTPPHTNMYPNGGPGLTGYLGYDTRYSGSPISGISYGQQFKANEGFHIPSLSLYGSKYGPGVKGGYTYINPNRMGTVAPFVITEIGYDPKRRGYAGFKGGAQFNILNNRYNKLSVSPQAGFSVMTPTKGMIGLQKGDIGLPDYTQLEYGLGADYEKTFDNKSKLGFYGRAFIDPISGKLREASQGKTTEQLEQDLLNLEGGSSYDESVRDLDLASEGLRIKPRFEIKATYAFDLENARKNKKIKEIIAKQNAQKTLDEQTKPSIENYTFMRDYKKGGNMYANGGYGNNNMNQIPVTQFGNGGSHEDNPLGGIPQGMGANGKMNLVEEGELKIPDPRPQSEGGFFIVSADPTMKITKDIADTYNLPKKLVGKSVLKAAESILRKGTGREADAIEENSINIDLANFLDAHEELTARKEAQEEGKFMEELAKLEEKYPEYMEALMGGGQEAPMEEMPMDPSMQGMPPQGPPQMSPEEQAMMEQQMMAQQQGGMPQGMPPGAMPIGAQGMDPAIMGGMPPEAMGMPMMYGGEMYAKGGKMPKEVLRARAESHMSKEAADAYVNNYEYGGPDDPDYSNYIPIKNRRDKVRGFRIKDNSDYADHSTRALPIVDRTIVKPGFFNKRNEEWERVMNAYEENPNQFSMYYNPFKYGGSNMYGKGSNMIKRADGSYSLRGLWDNIRDKAKKNKAAGKKGTKPKPGSPIAKQIKKIESNSMGYGSNMYKYGSPPYWGPGIIAPYKNKKYLDNPFGITPARIKNVSATRTFEHPEGGYGFWDGDNPPSVTFSTQPLNKRGIARFRNPKSFNVDLEEFDYERTPLQAQGAYFGNVNYDGSEPDTANMQVYKRGLLDRTFNPEYQDLIYKEAKDIYKKNKKEMGGNMYEYGSTMGNMYYPGGGMDIDVSSLINKQTQLTGGVGDDEIGIGAIKYPEVKFDYEPNPLNIAAQYLPAIANLGMGFLPSEDYTGALGRMQPVELERQQLGQRGVQIDQSFAQAQAAMEAAGGPGYISNIGRLQLNRDQATQQALTDIENANAQIANAEAKLNLEVQKGNMTAQQAELQLTELAEAAKSAMLEQGLKDVGTIAQDRETDRMTAEYLKLLAPQYT